VSNKSISGTDKSISLAEKGFAIVDQGSLANKEGLSGMEKKLKR
jgi:hypothetical protein